MFLYGIFKKVLALLDKKQRVNFFLLTILMLIAGLLETIGLSLFIPIVYVLIDDNAFSYNSILYNICSYLRITTQKQFLVFGFFLLGAIYILKNAYLYFQTIIQNKYVYNNRAKFFNNVYSIYLNKDYYYFVENSSGAIARSIYYDVVYTFDILLNYINIITESVISFIILTFLFIVNWKISVIACLILMFELIVINNIIKPILLKNGKINLLHTNNFLNNIIQTIDSIKEIKVFNTENYFINKNESYVDAISKSDKTYKTLSSLPKLVIEGLTFGLLSFALSILAAIDVNIKELVPPLSAFAIAAIKLLPSLNKISTNVSNISYYTSNLDNLVKILNEKNNNVSYQVDDNTNFKFDDIVEFKNVYFKYNNSSKYIFEDLNFVININKTIGIVGESGVGKTTLVDLLTGLLDPNSGEILCDGVNIKSNYNSWLSLIGYIPQNATLINDSIKSNVAFGIDPDKINEERLVNALKDAQIYDFVINMDNGVDTNIGDRGIKLSGGQRQRIGIARALYKNPQILIFDESTSSLDNSTESEVMKSIDYFKNKKTVIIIAHRTSTLKNCDMIYRVSNGKVSID